MTNIELRQLMQKHGLTNKALGDAIGKSERMIKHYTSLNKPHPIPKSVLIAIATLYKE